MLLNYPLICKWEIRRYLVVGGGCLAVTVCWWWARHDGRGMRILFFSYSYCKIIAICCNRFDKSAFVRHRVRLAAFQVSWHVLRQMKSISFASDLIIYCVKEKQRSRLGLGAWFFFRVEEVRSSILRDDRLFFPSICHWNPSRLKVYTVSTLLPLNPLASCLLVSASLWLF